MTALKLLLLARIFSLEIIEYASTTGMNFASLQRDVREGNFHFTFFDT